MTAGVVCILAIASPALGQGRTPDTFLNQQRTIEEQIRSELDRELPVGQKIDWDWGGWYNVWAFHYDDGIKTRTMVRNDFRLWTGATLDQGAHEMYVRGRWSFIDWSHGDSYDRDDHDVQEPNLERGYYQFDLRNAMKAYGHRHTENDLTFKIGRDYVEFGTGYALSMPLDQVTMTAEVAKFQITGLMAQTIHSMDDMDRSARHSGESYRTFWGIQAKYLGLAKHEPFAYVLWQDNQRREHPWRYRQNWDYDSFYAGFGSRGELIKNLRYGTEWVFEHGSDYGNRRFLDRDRIDAWAFDVLLEYLTRWRGKPRFVGEYMFASGDPDRYGSPTNAVGGNTRGDDTSFNGFGYRDTGLSFAPSLSNIHIWRLGASFFPFEEVEPLSKLELGTDWFLYWKQRRTGAVSDATADERSGYLGWEMDYFANWRLTSDLSWTVRYGIFFPGRAFSDESTRTFFMTGMAWSF
ncbi:MAG: alginate export family protein [Phycisphaerae bacterium]